MDIPGIRAWSLRYQNFTGRCIQQHMGLERIHSQHTRFIKKSKG